ncbi:histidine phosphatase family protein, partial [Oenococcus oeni]|uniref:histidine phosphatase family protein n=1 Tax=Oenococcus oeni TaxID=1247 RepID=UPI0015D67711
MIDFIRHGEPDTHIHDDRLRPLTTRGQRQSHAIATNLIYIPYTAVYASPAARATETVQPLATVIGKEIIHDDRLLERQMPDWVVDFPGYVRKQWTDLTYAQAGG